MANSLHILGIDGGMATMGLCLIEAKGRTVRAIDAAVVKTAKNSRYSAAADENRRHNELARALGAFIEGHRVDVAAVEYYRPFKANDGDDQYRVANGRLVSAATGGALWYMAGRGARTVLLRPDQVKSAIGVTDKPGVATVMEARIDGLAPILDRVGRTGYHATDAAVLAYVAMMEIYKAARRKR
jgi:Holliday junction resolvasome RuvABC endonuclease subunit